MDFLIVTLRDFWQLTLGVWKSGILGIDIGRLIIAIAIFTIFLILRRLFTHFVLSLLKRLAKRTESNFDDQTIEVLEHPIRFIPIVVGSFFVIEYLELPMNLANLGDYFVKSLITYTIFWALFRIIDPLSHVLGNLEKIFTQAMIQWLVKAIKATFIFIGAATILQIWGIEVGPILAGLGLFGVAVALGAQDLFKNLISGILIIAEKRFNTGDFIKVEGTVEGIVESIGFRSTVVRRLDSAPVFVPNAQLSDTAVINFSSRRHRRINWTIGVEYRTSTDQLRTIRDEIESYILGNDAFVKPPENLLFVRVNKFSDSSIDIMLYCYTKTTDWGEWLKVKESLAYAIKEIVENAGSAFAFPSQSLYIENNKEDSEPFVLPDAVTQKKQP